MFKAVQPKTVTVYQDENGHEPFTDWLESLRDQKGRRTILRRIGRLEHGLYGDCEPVGEAVSELRIFLAPAIGFILEKKLAISLSCYVVAIKTLRIKIFRQRRNIGGSIKVMAKRIYRKFREVEENYFRKHPDEIDDYMTEIFDEFAQDGNTPALLSSLRVVSRVKGISEISRETGITRNGIQKALSGDGNPRFDNINAIMNAMGYRLAPQKLDMKNR